MLSNLRKTQQTTYGNETDGLGKHSKVPSRQARPWRTKRIAFQDIDHIERLEKGDWFFGIRKGAVRIFGVGGVFGFIGLYRLKGIGNFWSYVTDEKKAFVIYRKNSRPIAVSVSEPDDFLPYYLKGGSK